ncbi:sugar phosphate permease [Knoellia remsis]|uniref:Sugar phosphate permease n=1 Tax=Knoellia remsis TaxID=407159 RepID=A0A2T0UUD2_9MICO|nr:MFS transporter [Knoellia remsis]PRY61542.1 sugar phosphate permease [Knoellia remsis]
MDHGTATTQGVTARHWLMLAVSTLAQAASAVVVHGPPFLIPALTDRATGPGLSLPEAGLVAAAPMVGVLLTLVAWGLVVDRRGERFALVTGLAGTTVATAVAALGDGPWWWFGWLVLAGAFAASANAASGRVVVGWFPAHRRGTAMGIRQMAQPLGVGIGAATLAVAAERFGIRTAIALPALVAFVALVAVAVIVADPPRPDRATVAVTNPYAADRFLARVHLVSVLLVVPQFLVWSYALAWLVTDRGWSAGAAGALVAVAQLVGAFSRIAAGALSDRVGSRMRPLRWVALCVVVLMLGLGLTATLGSPLAVALLVAATGATVADNGLAFTAVAERAGPFWSGRALGIQNSGQYLVAAFVPPVAGALIARSGYAVAFASAAAFAAAALPLVPGDPPGEPTDMH